MTAPAANAPSPAPTQGASPLTRLARRGEVWAAAALGLLLLFNFFFTPDFFSLTIREGRLYGSLVDVLNRGAPVALLAVGMSLVIATGGIDLSVGATMAIAGATAACLIARPELSPLTLLGLPSNALLAVALAIVAGMLVGLWNGALVAWVGVQPIVATLILMGAGRGLAQLLTAGQIVTFQHPEFHQMGAGSLVGVPIPIYLVVLVYCAVGVLTRQTALGLFIEAVGGNARASRYAGLSARTVKLSVYIVSGFCAALAGLIVTADIQAADANNSGLYLELDAILAVAVGGAALTGGRFFLVGTLIGAMLIQTLTTTILLQGVPPAYTLVLKAIVVVFVCLLHSAKFRSLFRVLRRRTAAA